MYRPCGAEAVRCQWGLVAGGRLFNPPGAVFLELAFTLIPCLLVASPSVLTK